MASTVPLSALRASASGRKCDRSELITISVSSPPPTFSSTAAPPPSFSPPRAPPGRGSLAHRQRQQLEIAQRLLQERQLHLQRVFHLVLRGASGHLGQVSQTL